jgi:hypothetical protein
MDQDFYAIAARVNQAASLDFLVEWAREASNERAAGKGPIQQEYSKLIAERSTPAQPQ